MPGPYRESNQNSSLRATHSQVTVLTELPLLQVKSTAGTAESHPKKNKIICTQKDKVIVRRAAEGPVTNVSVRQERSECI